MQRLNLKLVIWLGAAGLIAVVAMFFLHQFQMTRTAFVLKSQAEEKVEEGDKEAAIGLYGQYLEYRPDDSEAAVTRAYLMADLAEQDIESGRKHAQNALALLEDAQRNDPSNEKIRRRLIDFALYAGHPTVSIAHINALLAKTPDDPELLAKLGACLSRTGANQDGVSKLREAINKGAHDVDTYYELAVTLRNRLENDAEADKVIEEMVDANKESAKAYLRRAQWLREVRRALSETEAKRRVDQVNADTKKSLELDPENADCLHAAAQLALSLGQLEKVKELMNKGHALHPKDERMVQMLVEVAIRENKLDEVDKLVESMPDSAQLKLLQFEVKAQNLEKDQAREIVDKLEAQRTIDSRTIDYMRARLLILDGKWLEASREFERLRASMPGLKTQIDLILGRCYEILRQTDKQLAAYKRAVGEAPGSLDANIGLGRALQAVGQNAEALNVFQQIKGKIGTEGFAKLVMARNALLSLLIEQNVRLPKDKRNWAEVDELMAAAKKATPDSKDLALMDAKILEQKGDVAKARDVIQEELAKDGKNITPWMSLISLAFDEGGAAGGLKAIDEAQTALGDLYELRAMRVSCAAQLPPEEAKKILAETLTWIDSQKSLTAEQIRSLRQLIGATYFRMREFGPARKVWQSIADTNKDDQQALLVLFDIGINELDDAKVVEAVTAIKRLLGADSAEAKYVDVRRNIALMRAKKVDDVPAMLKDARRKIREATDLRPTWNALPRVEAEIDMYEGRPDEAILNLQKALDFGATDFTVVRQLAELLTIRGRVTEATDVLKRAQDRAPNDEASETMELIDVSKAISDNNIAKAIEILSAAHARDPDDIRKTVWLGQILSKAARYDEAEALFREAIEKNPDFPTTWQELVTLLRDQRRESDAREVIKQALEKIEKPQNELIAGQCCEILGDLEAAEQHTKNARDQNPSDLGLARALAMYYARQKDFEKVRAELDRMLAFKPANSADREQIAWANREVAIMIAGRGTYSDLKAALNRLNEKDVNDKATMAALLANRPEAESRKKAVRLLEEVRAGAPLTFESRLVLARLYDLTGDWGKCKDELFALVASAKNEPKYLAVLVEMLIDHNELTDAQQWMTQLDIAAPGAPMAAAIKAKLLVKQGKPEEAIAALRELLPRPMPKEMLPTLLQVAQLLESLKLNEAAEPMYREYSVLNPQGALELAGFLGRHGSLQDALDMCEASMDSLPTENVLRASIQILRDKQGIATADDFGRVGKWITSASAKKPKSMLFKLIYAELLDLQQNYPDLEEHYKALLQNPDVVGQQRAIVLNNLAFLLAVQNRAGESQKLIDEAIQIFGPTSDLLDTRALVEMSNKQAKQAIADLDLATVDHPTGLKYFHLAQAHLLNKDSQAATEAMKKALDTYKLDRKELAPAEQPKFDALLAELGLKQSQAENRN